MKKKWLLLSALISLISRVSASDISLQEAVELRRIAEYCKENNFFSAKTQIHCFFNKFPHSSSKDALYAMLGDIFFTENDYASALKAYSTIRNEDLHLKTEAIFFSSSTPC